ncbi:hypothetical protein HK098_007141 [Nowakowskiella sp. JEL0407]|nr:hypothetical protein HK098_007141 [Nowakowskiella sp. JEL0407]
MPPVALEQYTVQTVGEKETEITLYALAAVGVLACISNVCLSVWNYTFGPAKQRKLNLALIVLAVLFILIPAIDIIQNFAIFHDQNPKHTIQFLKVGGYPQFEKESTPEDKEWRRRAVVIGNLYMIVKVPLMNLHVVAFYFNFKNIKKLRPYTIVWDFLFLTFMFLMTVFIILANTVFLSTFMYYSIYIAFFTMFVNTLFFHHFAIYFIVILSKFIKRKREQITARMTERSEMNLEHAQKVSNSLSITRVTEKFSKGIFNSLILCGIMLWASNILFVVGLHFPLMSNSLYNATSIVVGVSHILMTVQLNFTLTFISAVRKMIESLSPREIRAEYEERLKQRSPPTQKSTNATAIDSGQSLQLLNNELQFTIDTSSKSIPPIKVTEIVNREQISLDSKPRSLSESTMFNNGQQSINSNNSNQNSRDRVSFASTALQSNGNLSSDYGSSSRIPPVEMQLDTSSSSRIPKVDMLSYLPTKLKVMRPYIAEREDELTLRVGDIVYPNSMFDDGWAFGRCLDSYGFFPLTVCSPFDDG